MALEVKNIQGQQVIKECEAELKDINNLLAGMSGFNKQVPFLTRYAIILSAGSIELACKTIIIDYCEIGANVQAKKFLNENFRNKPMNLKYDRICSALNYFDTQWSKNFKAYLKGLQNGDNWKSDLNSLIDLRNNFAHGGKPTATFGDIYRYFKHGRRIVIILERSILKS